MTRSNENHGSDFLEAVTGNDRRRALEALIEQVAAKLDAGMCTHCGGPRGEASGFAALTLRLTKLFDAVDALPVAGEVTELDRFTARRAARRANPQNSAQSETGRTWG